MQKELAILAKAILELQSKAIEYAYYDCENILIEKVQLSSSVEKELDDIIEAWDSTI